jgi:hypothetical protein
VLGADSNRDGVTVGCRFGINTSLIDSHLGRFCGDSQCSRVGKLNCKRGFVIIVVGRRDMLSTSGLIPCRNGEELSRGCWSKAVQGSGRLREKKQAFPACDKRTSAVRSLTT